ncbi:acyl-CoA desaturase [Candidatus Woesearchaeota archaeon]|nr:acyl-CoA desaturase [Candidatus Woesearchaeota archaeon]
MDYAALRKEVMDSGLLDRQYGYYAFKIVSSLVMFFAFLYLLFTVSNVWMELLLIIGLVIATLQFAFLGHDGGHQAAFKSALWNDALGLLSFGFIGGIGYNYWASRHNEHHANPNHEDDDPDFTAFAQSEEVITGKKGLLRFIYERQHLLYLPIVSLYVMFFHIRGIAHNVFMKNSFQKWADSFLMAAHIFVVWVPFFLFFAWWKAVLYILALRLLSGAYFGTVSASNHKGMRIVRHGEKLGWVEKQVCTTRNLKGSRHIDFFYGCLNYQIEHHLFPTMPRNNLRKCKPFIVRYCRKNNLPYIETGVIESYRQVIGHLKAVAVNARRKTRQASPVADEAD